MKKQQLTIALSSIGLAASFVVGGAVITSGAGASSTAPNRATVTVAQQSGDGPAITCSYDDIPVADIVLVPGSGASVQVAAEAIDGPVFVTGGVEDVRVTGSGTPAAALPDAESVRIGAIAVDGSLAVEGDVRAGTPEECAAIRPVSLPAPLPGAAGSISVREVTGVTAGGAGR